MSKQIDDKIYDAFSGLDHNFSMIKSMREQEEIDDIGKCILLMTLERFVSELNSLIFSLETSEYEDYEIVRRDNHG